MGCGASADRNSATKYNKTGGKGENGSNSEEEGSGSSPSSMRSNSVVSNSFTTTYAKGTRTGKQDLPAYKPGSSAADADAEFERWKNKNRLGGAGGNNNSNAPGSPFRQQTEEKVVDDFVFGDFKVDPGDVQQMRIERFNRVRGGPPRGAANGNLRRGSSGRDLLNRRTSCSGTFVMNDFSVKTVDEGDDPMYRFLHEVKVPPGFHPLQRVVTRALPSNATRVKVLAISPSETEFVSGSTEDETLSMYTMETGDESTCFVAHTAPIVSAVFSRDGKHLATSARDNSVIVWDTMHKDNAKRIVRTLDHACLVICVAFSSDGKFLVCGCQDKLIRVWDIGGNEITATFEEHQGVVVCVTTHSEKPIALSGGGDRVLRMWDITTAEGLQKFIGHDGIVISAGFTPNGEKILSNDDRAVKMWNAATGACILNVTLQSLMSTAGGHLSSACDFPPPMPLPRSFLDRLPLTSKQLGLAPNGILGPVASSACRISANKSVFTLSCLLPGLLSHSYFAVACSNRMVYIVSCDTGLEAASLSTKSAVFALAAGRDQTLMYGDVYGNIGVVKVSSV